MPKQAQIAQDGSAVKAWGLILSVVEKHERTDAETVKLCHSVADGLVFESASLDADAK